MSHTGGVWKYEKSKNFANGRTRFSVVTQDDGFSQRVICDTPYINKFKDHEDNARLIAAAPELLKALKFIASGERTNGTKYDNSDGIGFVGIAKEAVSKAGVSIAEEVEEIIAE